MTEIRTREIIALSSLTEDEKHILMWDFDNIDLYDVLKSLSATQKYHGLGNIYIFRSAHGYNALCLDKFIDKEAYNIKLYTRFSDYNHTKIGYKSGSWCWRIGKDKTYLRVMLPTNTYKDREQSNAHRKFLSVKFSVNDFQGKFDKFEKVLFESYQQDVI